VKTRTSFAHTHAHALARHKFCHFEWNPKLYDRPENVKQCEIVGCKLEVENLESDFSLGAEDANRISSVTSLPSTLR
jgi:hypothetical protein